MEIHEEIDRGTVKLDDLWTNAIGALWDKKCKERILGTPVPQQRDAASNYRLIGHFTGEQKRNWLRKIATSKTITLFGKVKRDYAGEGESRKRKREAAKNDGGARHEDDAGEGVA